MSLVPGLVCMHLHNRSMCMNEKKQKERHISNNILGWKIKWWYTDAVICESKALRRTKNISLQHIKSFCLIANSLHSWHNDTVERCMSYLTESNITLSLNEQLINRCNDSRWDSRAAEMTMLHEIWMLLRLKLLIVLFLSRWQAPASTVVPELGEIFILHAGSCCS